MFTDWIVGQVGDDPELMAKVVPDYPATGKRTLQDNGAGCGASPATTSTWSAPPSTTSRPTRW